MRGSWMCVALTGCVVEAMVLDNPDVADPGHHAACEVDLTGEPAPWSFDASLDYGVWRAPVEIDGDVLSWESGVYDARSRVLDLPTGQVIYEGTSQNSYSLGRARGSRIDLVARDNQIVALNRDTREVAYVLEVPNPTWMAPSSAFAADRLAVVTCEDTEATVWVHDVASKEGVLRRRLDSGCQWRTGPIALSADGSTVAVAVAGSREISVIDVGNGYTQVLDGHRDAVDDWLGEIAELALSPDGTALLSVGADDRLVRWDLNTGEAIEERPAQRVLVNQNIYAEPDGRAPIAWSPDGRFFGWLDVDATLRMARACDGEEVALSGLDADLGGTEWQTGLPYGMRLDPAAGWLVTVHETGVRAWSVEAR